MRKKGLILVGLFLVIAILLSMGLSLVSAQEGKKLVFGYIAYSRKDVWNNYSILAFEYAARKKGIDTIVLDPEGNLEKAVAAMEDLIARKVDGISVFTMTPELDVTLYEMAKDAGIPITFENSLPADTSLDYISCVACQYEDIGYAAGKFISENYPGSKLFYVMGAPGMGITELYEKGLHRALEEYGTVELVGTQPTDWGAEQAMNVTQNAIQSGLEFDVIFANNEQMATGVINALKDAGLFGKVKIVSTGGGPHGLEMIAKGEIDATMSAPVSLQGLLTFKNLYQYVVKGVKPPKFIPLPIIPITKDNLDEAIPWEINDETYERAVAY
ncbi:MAG: sugar ABC transporter substrate-binding protein, partial [Candidatus Atribacteria bacterium]|nr:sugar ABC transporter substrate-binding protein [Candidatus Atribacteria bacterium]MCD6349170.1 sugar ABC transporter substrate-binding protein [Candidatus Atribacteria bacterium]